MRINRFAEMSDRFRKRLLEHALRSANNSITEAAKLLGMQRTYLYVLIRRYKIRRPASAERRSA